MALPTSPSVVIVDPFCTMSFRNIDCILTIELRPIPSNNGLFLTFDDVFPMGATETQLMSIYRPRPGFPLSRYTMQDGSERLIWTTFTPKQIDINVYHDKGKAYLDAILKLYQSAGITMVRLDAAGYAIKKAGTSCFMIPETFAFIHDFSNQAK